MTNPNPEPPRTATIDSVNRLVARLRERLDEAEAGRTPIGPLDAYLLHQILAFCPDPVIVVDLACGRTAGTMSAVALSSPEVARVLGVIDPAQEGRLGSLLTEMASQCGAEPSKSFVPLPDGDPAGSALRAGLAGHAPALFVIDPASTPQLGRDLGALLGEHPHALVLVLAVGSLGTCDTAQELVRSCEGASPFRFWLLREASGALHASRLALVARRDHPFAREVVLRLEEWFRTNFDELDLLDQVCRYAIEQPLLRKLQAEVNRLTLAYRQEEETRRRLEDDLQHARDENAWLTDLKKWFETNKDELERYRVQLEEEVRRLQEENSRLREEDHQLREDNDRLRAEDHPLHEEIGRLQDELVRVEGERQQGERTRHELEAQMARLHDEQRLLQARLDREYQRPVARDLILQAGRRILHLGRAHRAILAPRGGWRERAIKKLLALPRRLRG